MTTETKKLPLIDSSILIPRKEKSLKPTLDVFFCFDDAFCLPTGISALSVLKNNKDLPLNIHLVGVDISEQNLGYFRKLDCAPALRCSFIHLPPRSVKNLRQTVQHYTSLPQVS